jgi:hypothetical protein
MSARYGSLLGKALETAPHNQAQEAAPEAAVVDSIRS